MSIYDHRVSQFSPRALSMLASLFNTGKVNVELSTSVRVPGSVQLESRTLLLHPAAGLYDLFVMALLQRHRSVARKKQGDEQLSDAKVARLVTQARRLLASEFVGAERFAGFLHPVVHRKSVLPQVAWRELTVEPLALDGAAVSHMTNLAVDIPFRGNEGDAQTLINGIMTGAIATEQWTVLREMPIATVPLRFMPGSANLEYQRRREKALAEPMIRQVIKQYSDCYRNHSQARLDSAAPRHRRWGTRLNFHRLVDATVGARVGYEPRLFVTPRRELQQTFLPEDHLVMVGIDLESLRHRDDHARTVNCSLALVMVRQFLELEVDLAVMVFADALLPLPDGRTVYLHQPAILKRPSDPADENFWGKLELALFKTADAAEDAGSDLVPSFQPLQIRTIAREMSAMAQHREYRNFSIQYIATRMVTSAAIPQGQPLYTRMAESVDQQVRQLKADLGGAWNDVAAMPRKLIASASRGGFCHDALGNFE